MQKNRGKNFSTVEVDPVTGEYVARVPEWIISEFDWYEGMEINMEVDGSSGYYNDPLTDGACAQACIDTPSSMEYNYQ